MSSATLQRVQHFASEKLGANVTCGKKARDPEPPEYPTYREPGAPKTKNKASGLLRVGTLPGSPVDQEEE